MKTYLKRQKGELSLIWVAVSMAALTSLAMVGLFWMRYERNLFAEAWAYVMRTPVGQTVKQTQSAAEGSLKSDSASGAIRKCTIDGKVVYSNVDCNAKDGNSKAVKLHDTRGIDAPKAPPPPVAADDPQADMRQKLIEKSIPR